MIEKELSIKMNFYLTMEKGETKEEAIERFYKIMDKVEKYDNQESAIQVHQIEVQEL